jgi:hypothetical protein
MGQGELNLYPASLAPEQEPGSARSFGFVRRVPRQTRRRLCASRGAAA